MVFDDTVAGHHQQVAGADRNVLRFQRFGYPVADDAAGKPRRGPHLETGRVFGDKVGGDITDADPTEGIGSKINVHQRHRSPPGAGQGIVTAPHEYVEWLGATRSEHVHAALRRLGGLRAVAETVEHTHEGAGAVNVDGDKLVAADVFTGPRARLGSPFDRTQPTVPSHCSESTSTSR